MRAKVKTSGSASSMQQWFEPVNPKLYLPHSRTVRRRCSPMWIASGFGSVINACCISMTQARRGPGAGAACNCVETDSRSQPTPLANARVLTNDERIPLPAFVLGGSRASLKLSGQIVSFLLADKSRSDQMQTSNSGRSEAGTPSGRLKRRAAA